VCIYEVYLVTPNWKKNFTRINDYFTVVGDCNVDGGEETPHRDAGVDQGQARRVHETRPKAAVVLKNLI
jgi:hypothetical protein